MLSDVSRSRFEGNQGTNVGVLTCRGISSLATSIKSITCMGYANSLWDIFTSSKYSVSRFASLGTLATHSEKKKTYGSSSVERRCDRLRIALTSPGSHAQSVMSHTDRQTVESYGSCAQPPSPCARAVALMGGRRLRQSQHC
jgi:hypothetical protein